MQYRRLGRTDLEVSTICLGTMQFGWTASEETSFEIMHRAVELGCNFLDTANIYSSWAQGNSGGESETVIGNWLSAGSVKRENIILATKVRGSMGSRPEDQGLSRRSIAKAVQDSLHRMRTDYIDLYQVHWPDEEVPLEETLSALDDLINSGAVRYVGCSNYPAWLLTKSLWISDVRNFVRFETLQPHYNYVHRAEFERELQDLCHDQGIGVIPYSPLAGGFLTGKYTREGDLPDSARANSVRNRYLNEKGFSALEALMEMGQAYEASVSRMAIAWVIANPVVTSAIIGANSIAQLEETIAGGDLNIASEDKEKLDLVTAWK